MELFYQDPEKRRLQTVQIGILLVLVGLAAWLGWPALQLVDRYNRAEDHLVRGRDLLFHDQAEEAIQELEKCIALYDEWLGPWDALGTAYQHLGQLEQCEATYRRGLEVLPENAQLYRDLGLVQLAQGRTVEARESFGKAVQFDPAEAISARLLELDDAQLEQFGLKVSRRYRGLPKLSDEEALTH